MHGFISAFATQIFQFLKAWSQFVSTTLPSKVILRQNVNKDFNNNGHLP